MESLDEARRVFYTVYSPNTHRARKELSKSVFVATSTHDYKLFSYYSAYEIARCAAHLMAKNPLQLPQYAKANAIQMLTGLSESQYNAKIDALFLSKQSTYKEMYAIWENMNFITPHLDLQTLVPRKKESMFLPSMMFKRGVYSIEKASLFTFCKQSEEEFSPSFKLGNCNTSSTFFDPNSIEEREEKNPKEYAIKMLHTFWNFQKKSSEYLMMHSNATALYHAKYSKDFINLHQHSFFNHASKSPDELKFGVSIWAELSVSAPLVCEKRGITEGTLCVTSAKSYVDGTHEAVATLRFDYTSCFYKETQTNAILASSNDAIQKALGEEIYRVLSQQFYPLYGIDANKNQGIEELSEHFTYDEGERGAILNLREIYIDEKYSDKIIPELIRAIYDLINFNSGSTFPLFSCMVDGDVIVNEELFPLIKSPLCTLISAEFLQKRMQKSKHSLDFFSQYKANAHHYYNSMTFDPLRPIFVY